MVDKLTLFELHMDSPRFGTNETLAEEIETDDTVEETTREGPRFGRLVLASVAFSIAMTLLARRLVGGDDTEQIEIDEFEQSDDETTIEVEH